MLTQQSRRSCPLDITRACFASAADAAIKEGPEAKKEAKKSLLQSFLGAAKVTFLCSKGSKLSLGSSLTGFAACVLTQLL